MMPSYRLTPKNLQRKGIDPYMLLIWSFPQRAISVTLS